MNNFYRVRLSDKQVKQLNKKQRDISLKVLFAVIFFWVSIFGSIALIVGIDISSVGHLNLINKTILTIIIALSEIRYVAKATKGGTII